MRTLAISTLLLGTVLSPMVFGQDDNALHYNIVNVQAEASRQVSNDEMHATLYIEKSNKQPAELSKALLQIVGGDKLIIPFC